MSSSNQDPRKLLKIRSVNLQSSSVNLDENIITTEFSFENLERQVYRHVSSAYELEAGNDNDTWFEYHFIYSLGMRFLECHDTEEDNLEADAEADAINKQPLEITAKFKALYFSAEKINQDSISEFCKDNVGYHVWPYWREFVQNNCGRLGIISIPVETYLVERNEKAVEQSSD